MNSLWKGKHDFLNEQYQQALENFTRSIQIQKKPHQGYNNRGCVYFKLNQIELAIEDFKQAIQIENNFPEAHNNLGQCYFSKGLFEDALSSFNKALSLKNDYINALNNRGIVKLRLNQKKSALVDFQKVLDYEPENKIAYLNRSIAQAQLAVDDYQSYLDISNGDFNYFSDSEVQQQIEVNEHDLLRISEKMERLNQENEKILKKLKTCYSKNRQVIQTSNQLNKKIKLLENQSIHPVPFVFEFDPNDPKDPFVKIN
ncbi:tetratricopeptide repeat protein [Anaeramoeba ignava]|uniref:Tetratricopeptide repeat protein n=1 Tax=Anaeramoeba ignava TaxID=1746090 RepID=A0A9Q0R6S7_ANAIG|nr:tetratricopeptide repeat protein [Anaeramoeba ignava]